MISTVNEEAGRRGIAAAAPRNKERQVASPVLETGKLPGTLLGELLASPASLPPELLLPPGIGEDAGVIRVEDGALIVASDPVTLTGTGVAAHTVVVNANDVAVTGAEPRWFLCTVLLPCGSTEESVRAMFAELHDALAAIDAVLVGGHTEVTDAVTRPVVVGQMLGLNKDGRFIATGGARPGDRLLQVAPAPIEGAAVLATEAEARLDSVPMELLSQARAALRDPGISVVEPALLAARLGATALHDPTEGGLSAGLHELAEASGVALRVDAAAILWFEPGLAVSRALEADPWGLLASGTLLASFPENSVEKARETLVGAGHAAAVIARAEPGAGVCLDDGRTLRRYERDEVARLLASP
jgi:hydrogenase maturation factor